MHQYDDVVPRKVLYTCIWVFFLFVQFLPDVYNSVIPPKCKIFFIKFVFKLKEIALIVKQKQSAFYVKKKFRIM